MNDFSSASPNVIAPRHRLETFTPDAPRFLYFIVVTPDVDPITVRPPLFVLGPGSSRGWGQPTVAPDAHRGTSRAPAILRANRSRPTHRGSERRRPPSSRPSPERSHQRDRPGPRRRGGNDHRRLHRPRQGGWRDDVDPSVSELVPTRPSQDSIARRATRRKRSSSPLGVESASTSSREKLGQGTFGLVFTARDTDLDRDVAIKVLNPAHHREPRHRCSASSRRPARPRASVTPASSRCSIAARVATTSARRRSSRWSCSPARA